MTFNSSLRLPGQAGLWLPLTILICLLAGTCADSAIAQPPQRGGRGFSGGGPPGGGPGAPDIELVAEFDADEDGVLNAEERAEAKKKLVENSRGARGPGGRGRGGRRGPGGRGGNRPVGKAGPRILVEDAESFGDAELYDPNALRTIFLNFEEDDWEQELTLFKPTDVEIPAMMIVDGNEYPNVGVSFRGASSFFMIPEGSKRSLNLSVDFMDDDQKLYDYKSLNLLNCNGDASMMSSYLYAMITRKKIATPKVNFVKVVINDRSWGVFANAQQFNKDFLKENYGTRKGNRWKVSGSPRGDAGLRYMGDDVAQYKSRYDIKSKDNEQAWSDLIKLCKLIDETDANQLEEVLDPVFDIDGALWFLAADVALMNSDGYWTRASDYSLYQEKDGKFHVLPHDMNEAFRESHGGPRGRGRGGRRGGPPPEGGPGAESGGYKLEPLVNTDNDRFPLRSKLLANETLKTRYLQYVREIAKMLEWKTMGPEVKKAHDLILKEVKADTRKLMTNEAFISATTTSLKAKSGSLQDFCEKRSEFLLTHDAIKDLPTELVKLKSDGQPRAYEFNSKASRERKTVDQEGSRDSTNFSPPHSGDAGGKPF